MVRFRTFVPLYWIALLVAVAVTGLLDGPAMVVAIAGCIVGAAIWLLLRFRTEDPEAELQRMIAGGDLHERG